eukprot:759583-Hanusia_phi.AAC.2
MQIQPHAQDCLPRAQVVRSNFEYTKQQQTAIGEDRTDETSTGNNMQVWVHDGCASIPWAC